MIVDYSEVSDKSEAKQSENRLGGTMQNDD